MGTFLIASHIYKTVWCYNHGFKNAFGHFCAVFNYCRWIFADQLTRSCTFMENRWLSFRPRLCSVKNILSDLISNKVVFISGFRFLLCPPGSSTPTGLPPAPLAAWWRPAGRDHPEEGPVGGAARSGDVEWNEGVNVPGQKLDGRGNQLRDEPRKKKQNSGECHPPRHGRCSRRSSAEGRV